MRLCWVEFSPVPYVPLGVTKTYLNSPVLRSGVAGTEIAVYGYYLANKQKMMTTDKPL